MGPLGVCALICGLKDFDLTVTLTTRSEVAIIYALITTVKRGNSKNELSCNLLKIYAVGAMNLACLQCIYSTKNDKFGVNITHKNCDNVRLLNSI